jgi:enamine deaminase RidA (YjgF/YER057c/UK114 family)
MVEQIIMRIGSEASNNFDFEHIIPAPGKSFPEEVQSCIEQLSDFIDREKEVSYYVTHQTFFITARNRVQYEERSGFIHQQLANLCLTGLPATSIVAQSPVSGSEVVLELICTKIGGDKKVTYKNSAGIPYTVVDYGSFKAVHCGGLMGLPGDSITEAATKAFEAALSILSAEGLSIHHIIRQWNYIEDIAFVEEEGGSRQNYQDFNDIRSQYYEMGDFKNGFPAATGIGMNTGGVIIDFIALSESDQVSVRPIRNPGQVDAHQYSSQVLMGSGIRKCTPKFERAKMISFDSSHYFYVSGTASILGEKTMYPGDVGKQTLTTIENIYRLFSAENQHALGVVFDVTQIRFSHLRVYVKHQKDIPVVMGICKEKLNSSSSLFLESDVCREELLVEIEGVFTVDNH